MFKGNEFENDMEDIKCDLAIENMKVSTCDNDLLKEYFDDNITMPELISEITKTYIK